MQKIHALWKCKRLDSGLGPVLSRIQTHLKTTPSGGQNISGCNLCFLAFVRDKSALFFLPHRTL